MKRLMNGLLYQAAWFAVIMSAQDGVAWAGALVAAAVVGIHLLWNDNRYQEAFIVLPSRSAR